MSGKTAYAMSLLSKIATLILLRKTVPAGIPLIERLLAGMAAVLVLSLVASLLLGAWIMGLFYGLYALLLHYNVAEPLAVLSTGIVSLLFIIGMFTAAIAYARQLRSYPKQIISHEMPVTYRANTIANAFVDGLMGSKSKI